MDEKDIKKLPINDEFAQCMRKLRISSEEIIQKRREEMRNCNHLFVLLRKGEEIYGCHSTDYYKGANEVECVHCGLTNRFNKLEFVLDNEYMEHSKSFRGMLPSQTKYNSKTLESEMFEEIFKSSYYRGGKSFNNSNLNLISEECLLTLHPRLLYTLALQINPLGSKDEIFKIMKTLHFLETPQEKIRLQTENQAFTLLSRYSVSKPKSFVKK